MTLSEKHAEIVSYQLFAYQEVNGTPPSTLLWKKVGDVMALPLPMACTLTQVSAINLLFYITKNYWHNSIESGLATEKN